MLDVQTGNPLRIVLSLVLRGRLTAPRTRPTSATHHGFGTRCTVEAKDVSFLPLKLRPWSSCQVELVLENMSGRVAYTCHTVYGKMRN